MRVEDNIERSVLYFPLLGAPIEFTLVRFRRPTLWYQQKDYDEQASFVDVTEANVRASGQAQDKQVPFVSLTET